MSESGKVIQDGQKDRQADKLMHGNKKIPISANGSQGKNNSTGYANESNHYNTYGIYTLDIQFKAVKWWHFCNNRDV